jgi:sugar diacid utilization regulator
MSPPDQNVPSRVELDLQNHAKTLTVLTVELAEVKQSLAVITVENRYRDEKVNSITALGRTVLIAVITLFLGLVFAFLASGGLRVPPVV